MLLYNLAYGRLLVLVWKEPSLLNSLGTSTLTVMVQRQMKSDQWVIYCNVDKKKLSSTGYVDKGQWYFIAVSSLKSYSGIHVWLFTCCFISLGSVCHWGEVCGDCLFSNTNAYRHIFFQWVKLVKKQAICAVGFAVRLLPLPVYPLFCQLYIFFSVLRIRLKKQ